MSYLSIAVCTTDGGFTSRVAAATAQEQIARGEDVNPYVEDLVWATACASDVEAAYTSALAAGNPHPGADEAVITDGMILASVQANWPESTP